MYKVLFIPGLLLLACLLAGAYGIVHNQISYSVSHDYFHQFKFIQFAIPPELQNRLGASIIGWRASWWMGLVIGLFIVPLGFIVPGATRYALAVSRAFLVVAITTLLVGIGALVYAYFTFNAETVGELTFYGKPVNNPLAFWRAGFMHNYGYLGGILGIVTGGIWLLFERKWAKSNLSREE